MLLRTQNLKMSKVASSKIVLSLWEYWEQEWSSSSDDGTTKKSLKTESKPLGNCWVVFVVFICVCFHRLVWALQHATVDVCGVLVSIRTNCTTGIGAPSTDTTHMQFFRGEEWCLAGAKIRLCFEWLILHQAADPMSGGPCNNVMASIRPFSPKSSATKG